MDEIRLLSDAIANQIAAGEVVQRPASVVKELLENAIDAGAKNVSLIVKEAGRLLIQVIDDGKGMSATDARMCFERHATSKITKGEDLFAIKTMGFRGEALASIAAVAQVELKTMRAADELANIIKIDGSQIKDQSFSQGSQGTDIAVKNLFFNVPARRNFLKSNPVEMKHILDEFQRVALAHPEIKFSVYHNDTELYKLNSTTLSKRIVDVLDNSYKDQMAPCDIDTPYVKINGYIGKPQSAKKTRGDQYFFVNKRFIKSPYLQHAISKVYEGTISEGSNPFYVLFLEIDPKHIDINIHPTKTEIKFDDEKTVYAILRSAASKALGLYQLSPSLDFDADININRLNSFFNTAAQVNTVSSNANTFKYTGDEKSTPNQQNWQKLFDGLPQRSLENQAMIFESKANQIFEDINQKPEYDEKSLVQIHGNYILTQVKSGLLILDQRRAIERIYYEKTLKEISKNGGLCQQLLFPKTLSLSPALYLLSLEIADLLKGIGFNIEDFGQNSYLINGIPASFGQVDEVELLKDILEQYAHFNHINEGNSKETLAKTLAKKHASRMNKNLQIDELKSILNQLFETAMPNLSPSGQSIFKVLGLPEIAGLLI